MLSLLAKILIHRLTFIYQSTGDMEPDSAGGFQVGRTENCSL